MPNLQEIPQLFGFGNYKVTILFSCLLKQIESYKKDVNLDLEPEFQRGYVWTQQQKEKYVEYILRGGTHGRDILFNYPSWSKEISPLEKDPILNRMVIVDGKQRLSAVMDFLNDKLEVFGATFSQFEGTLRCTHYLNFHVNELTTRKDILEWYLQTNDGGTIHTKEELDKVRELLKKA